MFQRNDWIVGVSSILLGAFVLFRAATWHELTSLDPAGPGGIPKVLAWGIIIIGMIHLVGFFADAKHKSQTQDDWKAMVAELKPVIQVTIPCIIYILLIKFLGYLIATPLLIGSIMWVVKVKNIKSLLTTSIGATAIFFTIFYVILRVKLPMGFLEMMIK